jgi:cytochrome c553
MNDSSARLGRHSLPLLALGMYLFMELAGAADRQSAQYAAAARANPDSVHGEQIYAGCTMCHGRYGEGSPDGLVPLLASQHRHVLLKQLVYYRNGKRRDIRMEQIAANHLLEDPQSAADVAGFLAHLPTPPGRSSAGDGSNLALGARLYASSCASCHGAQAQGSDPDGVPMLQGQHYRYLLRQMYDAIEGRRPTFLTSHVNLLQPLQRDELTGIADFLARLTPAPADSAMPRP